VAVRLTCFYLYYQFIWHSLPYLPDYFYRYFYFKNLGYKIYRYKTVYILFYFLFIWKLVIKISDNFNCNFFLFLTKFWGKKKCEVIFDIFWQKSQISKKLNINFSRYKRWLSLNSKTANTCFSHIFCKILKDFGWSFFLVFLH